MLVSSRVPPDAVLPKPPSGVLSGGEGGNSPPDRPQTLGEVIRSYADKQPNQPAIISSNFAPLSYRHLQQQIESIGCQVRQAGLGRTSRIGIAFPDGPEAVLATVAVACSAVAVPIDPKLASAELDLRLKFLRLEAIILLRDSASTARSVAEYRGLRIIEAYPIGGGELGLQLDVPATNSSVPSEEPEPEAVAFILQTSGTTALPKLIPFSHRNMLAAAERLRAWFKLTPLDRCLSVSPQYYSHGLKVTVFTPLLTGGSLALPTSATAMDFVEWFDLLKPTWYSAGPTFHRFVLDAARATPDAGTVHSLRFVVSGGAPLPAEVRDGLQTVLGAPVLEHYGSSEAAQIAANLPFPGLSKPGTCGKPWPGTLVIVDEEGHPLPPDKQGEILVGGPTLTSGYLDDPELNRTAFVDGRLRTGDIGSLDQDGFLTLHGRIKELINRGGEKISAEEVENFAYQLDAVDLAAAVAMPDPVLGERVCLYVTLAHGGSITLTDVTDLMNAAGVARFKLPERLVVVEELPTTKVGKLDKKAIREDLRNRLAEEGHQL